eukprot:1389473-Lingulodinium_polyedra.AAC.1
MVATTSLPRSPPPGNPGGSCASLFSGTHCDRHAVRAGMWRDPTWTISAERHSETRQALRTKF